MLDHRSPDPQHPSIDRAEIDRAKIDRSEQNVRSKVTSKIWAMATGMMGISIPLCEVTNSGAVIPIMVVISAAVGTAAVWMRGGTVVVNSRGGAGEADSQKRIQELEERLANLESITNFEHKLIEAKYPNAAPVSAPVAPVFSFETPGGVMADSGAAAPSATARPVAQSG